MLHFGKWDRIIVRFVRSPYCALLQVLDIKRLTGFIHKDGFCMLYSLRELSISHSNLSELPDLDCLKKTLSSLRLLNSGIGQFPPCYFNRWRRLRHLSLTGNELTEVPAIESISTTLQRLFLAKNNINTIHGSWATADYKRLRVINLDHNKLTEFNFTDLAPLPHLAKIQLTGNQISNLYQLMPYSYSAYIVVLTKNPLVCDAKLAWIATSNFVITNGTCFAPRCLQGAELFRLSKYIDIGISDQQ